MTAAWKSNFPAGEKLVLLALCDNANDQGECYPSISMLAEKCSISEREVFYRLDALESAGAVAREKRPGRSTMYTINPCKLCTPANPAPLQTVHPTPANCAPITISEPSSEPSVTTNRRKRDHFDPIDYLLNLGVQKQVASDWIVLRDKKKLAVTRTAIEGIESEAGKAGISIEDALRECCSRGWAGFKAKWIERERVQAPSGSAPKPDGFSEREYTSGVL